MNLNTHILASPREFSLEDTTIRSTNLTTLIDKLTLCTEELRDCTKDFDEKIYSKYEDTFDTIKLFEKTDTDEMRYFIDAQSVRFIHFAFHYWELKDTYDDKLLEFISTILYNIVNNKDTYDENMETFKTFIDKTKEVIYQSSIEERLCSNLNEYVSSKDFLAILKNDTTFCSYFLKTLDTICKQLQETEVSIELDIETCEERTEKFNALLQLIDEALIDIKFNLLIESKMALNTIAQSIIELHKEGYIQNNEVLSTEAVGAAMGKIGDDASSIGKQLASLPQSITSISRKFKMFRMKAKNYFFYKKYLGRIDHLYERYSEEAKVKENKMLDDPVKILKEKATEYIERVSDEFVALHNELMNISKQLTNTEDPKVALGIINKYLREFKSDMKKAKEITPKILKATKDRVAQILLEGNHIYGYTRESIVAKDVPPANHAVVSLFVDNPHENPEVQSVSDIVKDVNSFKLIAANEKKPVFDVSMVTNNLVAKGVQSGDIKFISKASGISMNNIKRDLKENKDDKNKMDSSEAIEQMKYIWKGLNISIKYMVKMKKYIVGLIDGYFIMMARIDNLMKVCLTAMLVVEREKTDKNYKKQGGGTGFKADAKRTNDQYKQYDEEGNKIQQNEGDTVEKEQTPKQRLKESTNDIRNAMRKQRFNF